MTIKDICKLTLNDLRNIAIDFDSEYELVSKICGYDSSKLFYFVRHFSFTEHVLKYQNKSTKVIGIPMKNKQAPNAAKQKCIDNLGNAGCQIYKITINNMEFIGTDLRKRLNLRSTDFNITVSFKENEIVCF